MKQLKKKKRSASAKANAYPSRRLGQTRGWIAMGTLAAYAAIGGTRSALAAAAKPDPMRSALPRPRCR